MAIHLSNIMFPGFALIIVAHLHIVIFVRLALFALWQSYGPIASEVTLNDISIIDDTNLQKI